MYRGIDKWEVGGLNFQGGRKMISGGGAPFN